MISDEICCVFLVLVKNAGLPGGISSLFEAVHVQIAERIDQLRNNEAGPLSPAHLLPALPNQRSKGISIFEFGRSIPNFHRPAFTPPGILKKSLPMQPRR